MKGIKALRTKLKRVKNNLGKFMDKNFAKEKINKYKSLSSREKGHLNNKKRPSYEQFPSAHVKEKVLTKARLNTINSYSPSKTKNIRKNTVSRSRMSRADFFNKSKTRESNQNIESVPSADLTDIPTKNLNFLNDTDFYTKIMTNNPILNKEIGSLFSKYNSLNLKRAKTQGTGLRKTSQNRRDIQREQFFEIKTFLGPQNELDLAKESSSSGMIRYLDKQAKIFGKKCEKGISKIIQNNRPGGAISNKNMKQTPQDIINNRNIGFTDRLIIDEALKKQDSSKEFYPKLNKIHRKISKQERTEKLLKTYKTGLSNAFKVLKFTEKMNKYSFKANSLTLSKKTRSLTRRAFSHGTKKTRHKEDSDIDLDSESMTSPFARHEKQQVDLTNCYYLYKPITLKNDINDQKINE